MSRERIESEAMARGDVIVQFIDEGPARSRANNGVARRAIRAGIGDKAVYCDLDGDVLVVEPHEIRRLAVVPTAMFSGRNSVTILLEGMQEEHGDIWIDDVSANATERFLECLDALKARGSAPHPMG